MEEFRASREKFKMLEIGLGCGNLGTGASLNIWVNVTSGMDAVLWFTENDAACISHEKAAGRLAGINIVVGDQEDKETLSGWIEQTGGAFDDGGHKNQQIIASLYALWPTLNPGGFYFIEDIHVGLSERYGRRGVPSTVRLLHAFIEVLSIGPHGESTTEGTFVHDSPHLAELLTRYPFPEGLDMVTCQYEPCLLHKKA
jgi:hypothetical protein